LRLLLVLALALIRRIEKKVLPQSHIVTACVMLDVTHQDDMMAHDLEEARAALKGGKEALLF